MFCFQMLDLEIINAKKREDLCFTIVEWFHKNYLEDYDVEIIVGSFILFFHWATKISGFVFKFFF